MYLSFQMSSVIRKMSHTYLAMMKLGTVIPDLKKIQKMY